MNDPADKLIADQCEIERLYDLYVGPSEYLFMLDAAALEAFWLLVRLSELA